MRLSPWHVELAKLMAEGLPNREIKKKIQISDSRLSVLRVNPLVQQQVEKYRKLNEDKYKKALDVFADNAKDIAQEVVNMVKNPLIQGQVKLAAAKEVLDRASLVSNVGEKKQDGQTLTFEQLLRITKTTHGDEGVDELQNFDAKVAFEELQNDLVPVQEDVIDVTPARVSFSKVVTEAVSKAGASMPSIGDNGDDDLTEFKQKLEGLVRH